MRNTILLMATLFFIGAAVAQPYAIGTRSLTFQDVLRDRNITCSVFYPATVAGADMPVADGSFPSVVIGHGFLIPVGPYGYLGEHYAAAGYIVLIPGTEGGFAPVHEEFGKDLAFVASAIQALDSDAGSPFFGHVDPSSALMGHSMGGGAAVLGAANNTGINAVVLMAPAETVPSAIAASALITAPTLVLAASEDCVTPIAQHAQPIYDENGATCKAFVNILGGGHCYFADGNFTCSIGEATCAGNFTITRAEQHSAVLDVTDLWLDHFLRGSDAALTAFADTLDSSSRFSSSFACLATNVGSVNDTSVVRAYWSNATGMIIVSGSLPGDFVEVFDLTGKIVARAISSAEQLAVKVPGNTAVYLVRVQHKDRVDVLRVPAVP